MTDLSSVTPSAHVVVWSLVYFGRGCLLRDDIDCQVYELISVVGVVFNPFSVVAVVVFAAGNIKSVIEARLTHVHIEL